MMWLAGYPVTEAIRQQLAEMAGRYDAELDQAVASLEAEDDEEPLSEIVRRLSIAPGLRAFGVRPNRFRGSKAGEFETALHLTLKVLTGRPLGAEKLDDDQLIAIEHAILGQRSRSAVLEDTLRRERRRLEKGRRRPSGTRLPELEIAQQQKAQHWRSVLRAWLKGLNQEVGAGMVTSGVHFAEHEDLERRREECIAVWLLINRASLGGTVPLGPSVGLFLTWFVLRELSSLGDQDFQAAGDQAFRSLMSDKGFILERLLTGTFRLTLEQWGMPLPARLDRLAAILPLTSEEHPDAHLICRPIETGKRRARPDRVRAAALS
jgi:hypothetical protein